jgi:putative membrane protein
MVAKLFCAALLLGVAFAIAACGRSQEQASGSPPRLATPVTEAPASPVQASSTKAFVTKLAMANLINAETSRIAAQKTRSPGVRQFARTLITEIDAWRPELERLSANAGVSPPGEPDAAATATIEDIRGTDARGLDARYLDAVIATRQAAIDEAERYAQMGDDADLRIWASHTLPALRARLQEADTLRQTVNLNPPK